MAMLSNDIALSEKIEIANGDPVFEELLKVVTDFMHSPDILATDPDAKKACLMA